MSVQKESFTVCESTWSLQLRENKDFSVEEKGSELVEQRRLQLKRRKGCEREIGGRERQGYQQRKCSRQSERFQLKLKNTERSG